MPFETLREKVENAFSFEEETLCNPRMLVFVCAVRALCAAKVRGGIRDVCTMLKGSARNLATCRLLIVDDDSVIRELLREYVKLTSGSLDIEVVAEASNGHEAVYWAELLNPDIVVMDVRMPVMDGIEATKRIKQDLGLDAVVITATSFSWREIEEAAYQAGASFHLQKPFELEQLDRTLQEAVSSRALRTVIGA